MPVDPTRQSPPSPVLPVLPVALAYDELPVGSDLRREYRPEGAVTVTAPAGEPSLAAIRAVIQVNGVFSAAVCGLGLAILLWGAWPLFARLDAGLRAAAVLLLVVFCGGLFLLIWRVWYGLDLDVLSAARRDAAVLHADARGVLIDTAGPGGDRSIEVPAQDVHRISVIGWGGRIPYLKFERAGEPALRLLAGRHPAELRWVASTLFQALRQQGG